jgi:preprotein translocase subunit SecF
MKLDNLKEFYIKNYKKLMIIPFVILLLSILVFGYWKIDTGSFVEKDVSLKGGYYVSIRTDQDINVDSFENDLEQELGVDVNIKGISSLSGGRVGYSFEIERVDDFDDVKAVIKAKGLDFSSDDLTVEEISSSLGESFFASTMKAVAFAIIFMSGVVFFYFRKLVPSGAVILAAVSDLVGTLAVMNIFGLKLSTGSIAALLMLLGYSVDSDILLSTKILKRIEGTLDERVFSAIKTGLTMQTTTLVAMIVLYLGSGAIMLRNIALVLIIGLSLDMVNTWLQNTGILKWYVEGKK